MARTHQEHITATFVAIMCADIKFARLENQPNHEDSWIDVAGYAACGAEIALTDEPVNVETCLRWIQERRLLCLGLIQCTTTWLAPVVEVLVRVL